MEYNLDFSRFIYLMIDKLTRLMMTDCVLGVRMVLAELLLSLKRLMKRVSTVID